MLPYRPADALNARDFQVRLADHPGWVLGTARVPEPGEKVMCAAGVGTVTEVLGKTGDGSRLVQVGFEDPAIKPFFAAASNLLLPARAQAAPADDAPSAGEAADADGDGPWIGGSRGAVIL